MRLPGVSTGVTEVGKKYLEEVQQAVKYSSLLYFMLKPPSLFKQVFEENKKSQEKLLKNMCNFGARAVCSNGRISVSSYLDVDTIKYQYRMLNPTPLDCIAVGDRYLKRFPRIIMNLIDGSISSYFYILNSP